MKCPVRLKYGNVPDSKFDKAQLRRGILDEMKEHTSMTCVAKQIAKSHIMMLGKKAYPKGK